MGGIIKAVCVIIGTIIGAGFASGKEIYIFFNKYGTNGLWGIVVASVATGIVIYTILKQTKKSSANTYNEYLKQIGTNSKLREILNIVINIFLLITFYIMLAGFCAYFKQEWQVSYIIVGIAVSIACYITFMHNIEGVTKINMVLIPFLIIMILIIGSKGGLLTNSTSAEILNQSAQNTTKTNGYWLLASLEYASYNSILLIPMLIGLKKYTYKREKTISIIVSIIFCVLATILYKIIQQAGTNIANTELPLIYAVSKYGKAYTLIYGIAIASAIYTSAIAAGYGFTQNCSKSPKNYKKTCILICSIAPVISLIGFSYLVELLYPIFGLLGLVQIIYILAIKFKR